MKTPLMILVVVVLSIISANSQNFECIDTIMCDDNTRIEAQSFDCPDGDCDLTISHVGPTGATIIAIYIEVNSKGSAAAESADITPNGQSSFNIPMPDLPQIGSGHGHEAKGGGTCISGADIQTSYDVTLNGQAASAVNMVTFYLVFKSTPEVICGGSTAVIDGGYVFHGETTLDFTIPNTAGTQFDPKTVEVLIPLGDIDYNPPGDERAISIEVTAGSVTESRDVSLFSGSGHQRYEVFTLTGVDGAVTLVQVTLCSPHVPSGVDCGYAPPVPDGDSFIIGSIVVNAPCAPIDCGLPIELIEFTAIKSEDNVLIEWATATELNNEKFVVQVSEDGASFKTLTELSGQGDSYSISKYTFVHENAAQNGSKVLYYRLQQIDFDGQNSFSQIRTIFFDKTIQIALFPNPVLRGDRVTLIGIEHSQVQLFRINGSRIDLISSQIDNGISIRTDALDRGVYYIKSNGIEPIKLIVQ